MPPLDLKNKYNREWMIGSPTPTCFRIQDKTSKAMSDLRHRSNFHGKKLRRRSKISANHK